jgi:hypothetical protein
MMPLLKEFLFAPFLLGNINTLFKISVKTATEPREPKRTTKINNLLLTDIIKGGMIIDACY